MTDEPTKCEECNTTMSRIETHDCVEVSYEWNDKTKEYDEVDQDWCGNIEVLYRCPECGGELIG